MKKPSGIVLSGIGLICVAAAAVCIDLSSSVPQSAKATKPAPITVSSPSAPVMPPGYQPGGIAVCTTFPGKVSINSAGQVSKTPVMIDAQGHQIAYGSPVPLSQAPIDPLPAPHK